MGELYQSVKLKVKAGVGKGCDRNRCNERNTAKLAT